MKWDLFILLNYSIFVVVSSVHSGFFAFGLRRRTNQAMRGNPIIIIIYWSIHPPSDHLDEFHDNERESISDTPITLLEPNELLDTDHGIAMALHSNALSLIREVVILRLFVHQN